MVKSGQSVDNNIPHTPQIESVWLGSKKEAITQENSTCLNVKIDKNIQETVDVVKTFVV